ncbi:hypothetical protein B4U80_13113 [Leptotrombidium deliense]|uniref:Uncharacterized protein n=1 Tax=Leptotrombidium deliense TaxID=299467 RepID=A0A443SCI1_9ACAR|nr:hypothetical protein B4U80_13113 [Leptotrombidium deliense]
MKSLILFLILVTLCLKVIAQPQEANNDGDEEEAMNMEVDDNQPEEGAMGENPDRLTLTDHHFYAIDYATEQRNALGANDALFDDTTQYPLFDQLERSLGDNEAGRPFRWKHDTYIFERHRVNNEYNKDFDAAVNQDIANEQNGPLYFIGYDQSFINFVPKYVQRQNMLGAMEIDFIDITGREFQPTLGKHEAAALYVTIFKGKVKKNDTNNEQPSKYKYYVLLPFTDTEEVHLGPVVGADLIRLDNGNLGFLTPFKCRETDQPYTSFFYEADPGNGKPPVVYTYLPFIDPITDVSYVVQVWLVPPQRYFKAREKFNKRKDTDVDLLQLQKYDQMSFLGNNEIYGLPMYLNRDIARQSVSNLPVTHNTLPQVGRSRVTKLRVTIIEKRDIIEKYKNNIRQTKDLGEMSFAKLPLYALGDAGGMQQPIAGSSKQPQLQYDIEEKIGITNTMQAFYKTPFTLPRMSADDEKNVTYIAYILQDKYGRHYSWLPFTDERTSQQYLMQVWVWRSLKFASNLTTEHYFVKYGYYELPNDVIPDTPRRINYNRHLQLSQHRVRFDFYILSLAYVPVTCAQSVHSRKWVKTGNCVNGQWVIHGLWVNVDRETTKQHVSICNSDRAEWTDASRVRNYLIQVPEVLHHLSFPTSAVFIDANQWFDYQWCAHGYFLNDDDGGKAFDNPTEYFNLMYQFYNEVNLPQTLTMAGIIPNETALYPSARIQEVVDTFNRAPGVIVDPFHGYVRNIREIHFCFDKTNRWIDCDGRMLQEAKVRIDMNVVHYILHPETFTLMTYVILQLQYDAARKCLQIRDLRGSNYNHLIQKASRNTRYQHRAIFEEQLYTDERITKLLTMYPFWRTGQDFLESKIECAMQIMTKMKRIGTLYDYFKTGISIFRKVKANDWISDNMRNQPEVTREMFAERINELGLDYNRVIFLCKDLRLYSIRLCIKHDDLEWVPCTDLDYPEVNQIETLTNCPVQFRL